MKSLLHPVTIISKKHYYKIVFYFINVTKEYKKSGTCLYHVSHGAIVAPIFIIYLHYNIFLGMNLLFLSNEKLFSAIAYMCRAIMSPMILYCISWLIEMSNSFDYLRYSII